MDIIIRGVLDFIQSVKGRENTVIAGGAVRDEVYNMEPNDYDFCIPSVKGRDMETLAGLVSKEFKVSVPLKGDSHYGTHDHRITRVYTFEIEGKKVDLIGYYVENDEEFGDKVIKTFDYGLNMIYFNGSQVCNDNELYKADHEYSEMSLHNLDRMDRLPIAMKRYDRFNSRAPHNFIFRAPCLELRRPEAEGKYNKKKSFASLYGGGFAGTSQDPVAIYNEAPTGTPVGGISPGIVGGTNPYLQVQNALQDTWVAQPAPTPVWDPWNPTPTASPEVEAVEEMAEDQADFIVEDEADETESLW